MISESDIYARLGFDGFERLVAAFYKQVQTDELLGPMYPAEDMAGAHERLRDFLIQRFGGPTTYSQVRGHPRLRMRHGPFIIGPLQRDRWLELMANAMKESQVDPEIAQTMWPYFVSTANHMINTDR